MNANISLSDIAGTDRRVAGRSYRILEDGYNFAVEDLIIGALDRDALIVDAAFFVLVFGQLENRLNDLAVRRVAGDSNRGAAIREAKFERRLALALPGAGQSALRAEINDWYRQRRDAAHGDRLTSSYRVEAVFARAFELDALVGTQLGLTP